MPKVPLQNTQFFSIFEFLSKQETYVTSEEISKKLGISAPSVRRELANLKKVGKVETRPVSYRLRPQLTSVGGRQ